MRNQPEIKAFVLCAALFVSLLLTPQTQAAGRSSDRGDDDARVRTSEAISVRIAAPGPVSLHRLLRNYMRLQIFRLLREEPPTDPGYGTNGLSDDPDPTSDREDGDPEDPNSDSGAGDDNDPMTEHDDAGYVGLR
jgi:hypothetical protein